MSAASILPWRREKPVLIFDGTAREAAAHFQRHINVVVSLSLAGIGLDRTRVRIYANGRLPGARHRLSIDAAAVELRLDSQNLSVRRDQQDEPNRRLVRHCRAAGAALAAPGR